MDRCSLPPAALAEALRRTRTGSVAEREQARLALVGHVGGHLAYVSDLMGSVVPPETAAPIARESVTR